MSETDVRPVVVAVDGTGGSAGALTYAVAEAGRRHAPLRVVHAVPTYPPVAHATPGAGVLGEFAELHEYGERVLEEAVQIAQRLGPELSISRLLARGTPVRTVAAAAVEAQLVVLGREQRFGVERIVAGATADGVAGRARCEVVLVPQGWDADTPVHGRVVVAVKSIDRSRELLAQAFAEACRRNASLTVVRAWELSTFYQDLIEARSHGAQWEALGQAELEASTVDWRTAYPDVEVEHLVRHGHPADVILRAARHSDLVVLSRRHRALAPFAHLGPVAHAVLHRCEVPVLVVPVDSGSSADTAGVELERTGTSLA